MGEEHVLTKADVVHAQCYRQVTALLDQARTAAAVSTQAHQYAELSSVAGADAAGRSIRAVMAKQRQEALKRAVDMHKEDDVVQQAVHKMAIELPFSPTSLFGGRTQVVVNATEALESRWQKFAKTFAKKKKGGKPSLPDNTSGSQGKKRRGGQASGGPQAKQQRFQNSGSGGNSTASSAKSTPSKTTSAQQQHSGRKRKHKRKSHPQQGQDSYKGAKNPKQGQQ